MSLAVVDDERFDLHAPQGYHPERVERLAAARSGLAAIPRAAWRLRPAEAATAEDLARVHGVGYLRRLDRELVGAAGHLDADTYFSAGTREAAWLAAGSAAALARDLLAGRSTRGLALLRPPGHHATADAAMGFCLLNNVAVAAAAALTAGARRVAVVDWDVHHGNGTQDAFYEDPRVLFVSLHQWPFYPGTGAATEVGRGPGIGKTVNLALPAHSGPETYASAFRDVVLPLLDAHGADLTLVSAGFDAHERDPLASMCLDAPTYGALASALVAQAERGGAGHGRVGFVLEGGYDLQALEASVGAVARAAVGERSALPEGRPPADGAAAIERTRRALAPYWAALDPETRSVEMERPSTK